VRNAKKYLHDGGAQAKTPIYSDFAHLTSVEVTTEIAIER
jgi:hypothetical protein